MKNAGRLSLKDYRSIHWVIENDMDVKHQLPKNRLNGFDRSPGVNTEFPGISKIALNMITKFYTRLLRCKKCSVIPKMSSQHLIPFSEINKHIRLVDILCILF